MNENLLSKNFKGTGHSDLQYSNTVWTFKHNLSTDFLVDIKAAIQLPPSVKFLQYGSLRKMEREIYMWSEYKCFEFPFRYAWMHQDIDLLLVFHTWDELRAYKGKLTENWLLLTRCLHLENVQGIKLVYSGKCDHSK